MTSSPLDIDDLLCEIILRLPPHPSSLPRASAVCKRWLSLVSDPRFLRRFRIHHRRNPPLLGFFVNQENGLSFVPATDRFPPGRFSYQGQGGRQLDQCRFLSMGCRHGLVLIFDEARRHLIVWDPVTADHQRLTILEFGLEKQSLAVIPLPVDGCYDDLPVDDPVDVFYYDDFMVIRADGGGLGVLFVSNFTAELWERKTDCDGVASWVWGRTIELDKLLSLNREEKERTPLRLIGFAEENNVVILWTSMGLLELQLQSLQFKILSEISFTSQYHPFESVYTPETGIGDGHDETDLLHNT